MWMTSIQICMSWNICVLGVVHWDTKSSVAVAKLTEHKRRLKSNEEKNRAKKNYKLNERQKNKRNTQDFCYASFLPKPFSIMVYTLRNELLKTVKNCKIL